MSDQEAQVDEAFAMYLRACDRGEIASREEFLRQFPSLAGQLSELMEAADLIGGFTQLRTQPAAGSTAADVDASAPTHPVKSDEDIETIGIGALGPGETAGDLSGLDPHATLPVAHRPQGDSGPSLPFEMEDYTLMKVLGMGGMGVVYLAKQRDLDRLVAVKMIRSGILAGSDEVKRFYIEAKAAARLRHPNIVAVHQFGQRAGHHFFSMQYIQGMDLQRVLKTGPLPPRRAAAIVRDAARAIQHAHSRGVLHRDLKPGNVMIDEHDHIHVTDFGLAKHTDGDSSLTGQGTAIGTPHYMAPEQAVGNSDEATSQSDIYSLGGILFAAIAGHPPLVGDTVMQTLMRVAHHPAPALRSVCPDADIEIEAIVGKCLEKQPALRYATAGQLADDLDRYLAGKSITARSKGRLGKTVAWTRQVPLVAALTGHPTTDAPLGQRRFQTSLLVLAILLPVMLLAWSWWDSRRIAAMPSQVSLAGGLVGGLYTDAAQHLADVMQQQSGVPCHVLPTRGTWDNRAKLIAGEVQLAPMQASAVGGEELAVVAPLFYEAVHVLVRRDGPVRTIADLAGQRIAVGPSGSGSRRAADLVLDSLQLDAEVCPRVEVEWPQLKEGLPSDSGQQRGVSVAIICIGPGSKLVRDLLADGDWELISLSGSVEISLQHPTLRPMILQRSAYRNTYTAETASQPVAEGDPGAEDGSTPAIASDEGGIETLGTTAFLVCRRDASDALVQATLESLYHRPTLVGLIPANHAAEWQGLAFHRTAREYFLSLDDNIDSKPR
nr:serine/threonine-protein kinase [Allorhodopirellula solitaria]